VELKDSELKVAHQLIEALAGKWEPEKYKGFFPGKSQADD